MKYYGGHQYPSTGTDSTAPAFADTRFRRFRWNQDSIMRNAPETPGVYGLFNVVWIYIDETENIRAELLEHLAHESPNIDQYGPEGFAFELVSDPAYRHRRHLELIRELEPLAQRKTQRPRSRHGS